MESFDDYVKNFDGADKCRRERGKDGGAREERNNGAQNGASQGNLFRMVNDIARKFEGKDQNELLKAIFDEAKKNKKNGTLTNAEIDNFAAMLSPVLDDKKRKILDKIVSDLKKI